MDGAISTAVNFLDTVQLAEGRNCEGCGKIGNKNWKRTDIIGICMHLPTQSGIAEFLNVFVHSE